MNSKQFQSLLRHGRVLFAYYKQGSTAVPHQEVTNFLRAASKTPFCVYEPTVVATALLQEFLFCGIRLYGSDWGQRNKYAWQSIVDSTYSYMVTRYGHSGDADFSGKVFHALIAAASDALLSDPQFELNASMAIAEATVASNVPYTVIPVGDITRALAAFSSPSEAKVATTLFEDFVPTDIEVEGVDGISSTQAGGYFSRLVQYTSSSEFRKIFQEEADLKNQDEVPSMHFAHLVMARLIAMTKISYRTHSIKIVSGKKARKRAQPKAFKQKLVSLSIIAPLGTRSPALIVNHTNLKPLSLTSVAVQYYDGKLARDRGWERKLVFLGEKTDKQLARVEYEPPTVDAQSGSFKEDETFSSVVSKALLRRSKLIAEQARGSVADFIHRLTPDSDVTE